MKKQNGISLVALVITIIVMVVLAGIIITAAVADGGVIDRAQGAIKESERSDIQDIVIGSYVYRTTASDATYRYLDLKATAEAIYDNLTANKFKLSDANGVVYEERDDFVKAQPKNASGEIETIGLTVKGKYSEYIGNLDKNGIIGKIEPKPEPGPGPGPTPPPVPIDPEDLALLQEVLTKQTLDMSSLGQTLTLKNEDETKEAEVTFGSVIYISLDAETGAQKMLNELTYKGNKYTISVNQESQTTAKIIDVRIKENTIFYYSEEYAELDKNNQATEEYIVVDNNGNLESLEEKNESTKFVIYEKVLYTMIEGMPMGMEFGTISDDGKKIIIDYGCGAVEYEHTGRKALEVDSLCFAFPEDVDTDILEDCYSVEGALYISENGVGYGGVIVDEGLMLPYGLLGGEHLRLDKFGVLYKVTGATSQREYEEIAITDGNTLTFTKDYGAENVIKKGTVLQKGVYNFNSEGKSIIEVYDTEEYISTKVTIDKTIDKVDALYSGTISYSVGSDFSKNVLLKNNGLYINGGEDPNLVLDKENNTLTVSEIGSNGQPTGKIVKYTITDGNKLINKQVVNP